MANTISPFPTINSLIEKNVVSIKSNLEFYYYDSDTEENVMLKQRDKNALLYSLLDERGVWNHDLYELKVKVRIDIEKATKLYGAEGVVPNNAKIGVAFVWCSSTSKNRGSYKLGEIKKQDDLQSFEEEIVFEKAKLRGVVTLYLDFYIIDDCTPLEEESHLASKSGVIVGEVQMCVLEIDAQEKSFPIEYEDDESKPLWRLEVLQDGLYPPFGKNTVKIILNRKHADFEFIDNVNNRKKYNGSFLREVLSSAISLYIETLRVSAINDMKDTNNGEEMSFDSILDECSYEEGSVADVIKNFRFEPMNFDYSSPINTAMSIRKYFDLKLKKL